MYKSSDLAIKIKEVAQSKDIKLKEMWESCGLGSNTMSSLNHEKKIAFDSLAKVADYLEVSVDYLLGRTTEPTQQNINHGNIEGSQGNTYNTISKKLDEPSMKLNGLQKEMIEAMEQLPKLKQLEALQEVYKILEENK